MPSVLSSVVNGVHEKSVALPTKSNASPQVVLADGNCDTIVPTSRADTNVRALDSTVFTNADMVVTSDLKQPIGVKTSSTQDMGSTFPNTTIGAWGTTRISNVSASWMPEQSWFIMNCSNYLNQSDFFKVNIGQGTYVTNVSFPNTGRVGGVLAPTVPFSTDITYKFFFFVGPGLLHTMVNSVIQANLPAVTAWLKENPITLPIGSAEFVLSELPLSPANVTCSYAAVSPVAGDASYKHVNINAVLNISSATISGTLTWPGKISVPSAAGASISGLSVMIQATADLSDVSNPSVKVNTLQCSLQGLNLEGILPTLIDTVPVLALVKLIISSPYRVAGAINSNKVGTTTTNWNSTIISKINDAIANALHPKVAPASLGAGDAGYSTWMSIPSIQGKLLSQLKMPGTHDSATYGLTTTLSKISYPNIDFLWKLSPGSAPGNGNPPWGGNKYLGNPLYQFVMQNVINVSVAQDQSLYQQLKGGIRYFDLRVYYDESDGNFYTQHGARGPKLDDLLADVRKFIDEYPSSQELIWLVISHTNFDNETAAKAAQIISNTHKLGPYLYVPPNAKGVPNYDIQTNLGSKKISDIVSGWLKVIVLNTDTNYTYADYVVNTPGFASSGRWSTNSDGTSDLKALTSLEATGLQNQQKDPKPLYEIAWTLTAQTPDIVQNILYHCSGADIADGTAPTPYILRNYGDTANAQLGAFLKAQPTEWNVVTMDWYERPTTGPSPVSVIVGMN